VPAPAQHTDVRVPSKLIDARGEIHNLRIGGFRHNVLVSRPGALRSGDVHRARQLDVLYKGSVRVTTRERGRDVTRAYTAPALIEIPAHTPHIFTIEGETDAVMAEWWDGGPANESFGATRFYIPYRRQVDAALAELSAGGPPGGHQKERTRAGSRARRPGTAE
jgi:hypothetical protein